MKTSSMPRYCERAITQSRWAAARNEQERTNFLAQATRFIRKVQERHENVTAQLADLTGPLPGPVK